MLAKVRFLYIDLFVIIPIAVASECGVPFTPAFSFANAGSGPNAALP